MAVFDYITEISNAMWAAWEGDADVMAQLPVTPGTQTNVIWPKNALNLARGADIDSKLPFIFANTLADPKATSFPRAVLYQGDIMDGMNGAMPTQGSTNTFATLSPGGAIDWIEPVTINWTLTLVFRSCRLDQNNPLKIAICRSLRRLGADLGLTYQSKPYVKRVGPVRISPEKMVLPEQKDPTTGYPIGAIRSRCDILIPIMVKFHGPQLI